MDISSSTRSWSLGVEDESAESDRTDEGDESDDSEEDVQWMGTILENDDHALARTLLQQCGSKLTSLKAVDRSIRGRIWEAVLERIHGNRTLEGAQRLNGMRVLDMNLNNNTYNTKFRPLLYARPYKDPEAVAVFAGVTQLRFWTSDLPEEKLWVREEPIEVLFCDLVKPFPNLLSLSLDNVHVIDPLDDIEAALTTTMPLSDYHFRTLDFEKCWISASQTVQILKRSPRVQTISMGSKLLRTYDADLVTSLPMLFPGLTKY
ncbi:hypothetical protein BGZ75_003617 [Mortierella antarctica]|nr:hypothetical protein BGZ75_003617 [Mortierella antarctica]